MTIFESDHIKIRTLDSIEIWKTFSSSKYYVLVRVGESLRMVDVAPTREKAEVIALAASDALGAWKSDETAVK